MRHLRTTLYLTLLLLTVACHSTTTKVHDVHLTDGVSRDLATWRKATIHDIGYKLHFAIPEQRTTAIEAYAEVSFRLESQQQVVIDFRDTERIENVTLGSGESVEYTLENQHIVIPEHCTSVGNNHLCISYTAPDQSLNRNDEYLYTLLVPDRARTLFPCFDQPDMKATFELSLTLPKGWVAVSNTAVASRSECDVTEVAFCPTEPLSTYLFSFVAGKLSSRTYDNGDHRFTAYYRETDPQRLAQLDDIFAQVAYSLEWLEEYTAIEYPFAKYDFIMLPGFQYGGMEHTGATLYNDSQMFLSENPTLDEELRRTQLIAHETAHMWFGDYVTMRWFDDVWTKEVFANYFAARIAEPLYPEINHRINRLKTYTTAALSEDRTTGTTSIRQELDNLQNAGLIYGQIIYNKAPIVMDMMVELMGEEQFKLGIREYLTTYGYGNATWPELIAILDRYTDEDLATFSDTWVHRKGMPTIKLAATDGELVITQHDSYDSSICRTQSFTLRAVCSDGSHHDIAVTLRNREHRYPLPDGVVALLPNIDGRGYGLFHLDNATVEWLLHNIADIPEELTRQSLIMTLHECYEHDILDGERWLRFILEYIAEEPNYLIASTLNGYLSKPMILHGTAYHEAQLWDIATTHENPSLRRRLLLTLAHVATTGSIVENIYTIWDRESWSILDMSEYTTLAYELALRRPDSYLSILSKQRARLTNPDRIRQFDYISRAMTPECEEQDMLFASLLEPESRRVEPWAATTLAYLNHHTRSHNAIRYIYPALMDIGEVQRTGDIFFPRSWAGALLGGHYSDEARAEVQRFLDANPELHPLLRNKILQAANI